MEIPAIKVSRGGKGSCLTGPDLAWTPHIISRPLSRRARTTGMNTPDDGSSQDLAEVIARWQQRLLDLTKRNRLLYFRSGRSAVRLTSHTPDQISEELLSQASGLSFDYAERRQTRKPIFVDPRRWCMNQNSPAPILTRGVLPTDAVRLWPAQGGHLIQEVAREECLGHSPFWSAGSKAIPDDRFVPEEGVLCPSLPRVTRLLLPPSPPECLHHPDRAIVGDRPPSSSRHARSLGRWNDHVRATCTRSIVEGDRVVGRVPRDAREGAFDCLDQRESRRRVVGIPFGEGLGDDDSRSVDTHRELLPASLAASAVVHGGPFTFAHNREARAVDDEMQAFVGRNSTKREVEVLAAPGERRVIGRGAVDTHHSKERVQEALGLAQRQVADETERERGFDREGGVLELPSTRVPTRPGAQASLASGANHRVTSPRPTRARS